MFQYLVLVFLAFIVSQIFIDIKNRIFTRPKPTLKVVMIFCITIILYSLLIIIYWILIATRMEEIGTVENIEFLLFIYLVNPLVIFLSVLIVNPFFNYKKQKIIIAATNKIKNLKKVKVIGITGSYGKTSTKEFLFAILSSKYKVVKTEGNNNTNIGVAYTVLNKVSDEYDYFICEMGAYKIGEIAEICSIVNPEIGILTGINEQHIELFGSIENTRKAKFELIEALPEGGFAIINSGIKNQESGVRVEDVRYFSNNLASDIKLNSNSIEFKYKNQNFKINILGKHYIENLISAIIVAEQLGMNLDEISEAIKKIEPTEFMMRKITGSKNSIFIDDSYSANPDGVVAALEYLNEAYSDYRKIIIFPGIIELGEKSGEIHRKLFEKIDQVCDEAYIMNDDLKNTPHLLRRSTPLKRGIKKDEIYTINDDLKVETGHNSIPMNEKMNCEFIFENDFEKVAKIIRKDLDEKTVILFESRGAGVVMGKLRLEINKTKK